MNSWEQMSKIEKLEAIWWEAYKDAYGVRPRGISTEGWSEATFEGELKLLQEVIYKEEILRKEHEVQAIAKFEDRVLNLMHSGTNRERVIAWLMDAEMANGDFEYFAYTQGLPYSYFRKTA